MWTMGHPECLPLPNATVQGPIFTCFEPSFWLCMSERFSCVLAKPSIFVSKYVVRRGSAKGQPPQGCCDRLLGTVGTVTTSLWPICHRNNRFYEAEDVISLSPALRSHQWELNCNEDVMTKHFISTSVYLLGLVPNAPWVKWKCLLCLKSCWVTFSKNTLKSVLWRYPFSGKHGGTDRMI